jgi:hypothetical protein
MSDIPAKKNRYLHPLIDGLLGHFYAQRALREKTEFRVANGTL